MTHDERLDKVTSIIYYLYHNMKMNPNAMAGAHDIKDVFENACNLLLGMTSEQFKAIEKVMQND